jgi:hypothetical protein
MGLDVERDCSVFERLLALELVPLKFDFGTVADRRREVPYGRHAGGLLGRQAVCKSTLAGLAGIGGGEADPSHFKDDLPTLSATIYRCLGVTNFFGRRARAVANNENVRFT